MEAVAPIRIKSTLSKQKTPWRNTTTVKNLKRECRTAERKWRKTKLQIHYELYKQSLRSYNNQLCKARQLHLSEMINKNVNNSPTLFAMVEKLTNTPKQTNPDLLSTEKCNEFANLFSQKIKTITQNIHATQTNKLVKSCLGDSFDVAAESQIWVYHHFKVTNLVSDCKGPSLKVFTNTDPLLFATKQNDLCFVFI